MQSYKEDELTGMIDRLAGRVCTRKANLSALHPSSPDRPQEESALKHIEAALQRLRSVRDALAAGRPQGMLHSALPSPFIVGYWSSQ